MTRRIHSSAVIKWLILLKNIFIFAFCSIKIGNMVILFETYMIQFITTELQFSLVIMRPSASSATGDCVSKCVQSSKGLIKYTVKSVLKDHF